MIQRNAIIAAVVLIPWPGVGSPAAWWAHLLGQVIAEQSEGGAWVIAAAGAGITWWCWDRPRRTWDPERGAWRPFLPARLLLATTLCGAALALPLFDAYVLAVTGASS